MDPRRRLVEEMERHFAARLAATGAEMSSARADAAARRADGPRLEAQADSPPGKSYMKLGRWHWGSFQNKKMKGGTYMYIYIYIYV